MSRLRPTTYLSGPITKGDRQHNFDQAADAQRRLMAAGFAVLNPMLTMLLPGAWDIPHSTWIDNDLPWIAKAKAVLRLPGESVGADQEVAFARLKGISVYDDIDHLIADMEALL